MIYNALPFQYWKDQTEFWAAGVYPELWNGLQTLGFEVDEEGMRKYHIDRVMVV